MIDYCGLTGERSQTRVLQRISTLSRQEISLRIDRTRANRRNCRTGESLISAGYLAWSSLSNMRVLGNRIDALPRRLYIPVQRLTLDGWSKWQLAMFLSESGTYISRFSNPWQRSTMPILATSRWHLQDNLVVTKRRQCLGCLLGIRGGLPDVNVPPRFSCRCAAMPRFLLDLHASSCLEVQLMGTLLPEKTVSVVTGDPLTRLGSYVISVCFVWVTEIKK